MPKSFAVSLIAAFAATAGPRFASAGEIEFSFANQTPVTTAGGTGTIDVVVTETGSQDTLYQFQVETFLTNHGGSNIALSAALETGAPVPPGLPGGYAGGADGYVFGQDSYGNSAVVNGGPPSQIGVNNPTDVQSSDWDLISGTLLGGGTQYGLLQLTFTVPAGTAAGSYTLSFNQNVPDTGFDDSHDSNSDYVDTVSTIDLNPVSPGLAPDGAIVVTPEPGSSVLLLLGAAVLFGFRRLRNRRF
jgi:hypothetical protein